MNELPLRLPRGHAPPGDASGRVLTPGPLADAIVHRLWAGGLRPATVTEPSVGGGALLRSARRFWPDAHIFACDLDRESEGLSLADDTYIGDWPTVAKSWDVDDLNLGNPPYHTVAKQGNPGVPWEVPIGHVLASIAMARVAVQILPVQYICSATWLDSVPPPAQLWPISPRPWDRVREVAVYAWGLEPGPVRPLRWRG